MTTESLSSQSISFEGFLDLLAVPKSCEINKPVFKKMFLDASDGKKSILDAADKKTLKDDVEKIRWLYTLKPSTINIAPYKDQEREYPEVAILHVELSAPDKIKRIAQFINRAIPYPLVLLFTCEIVGHQSLLIALADKRINQADKEKWVIEDGMQSPWIGLASIEPVKVEFLESLKLSNMPFTHFYAYYRAFIERVVAVKCAEHSGQYSVGGSDSQNKEASSSARLDKLRELDRLDTQHLEISRKLKKEKQMGRQVDLNTQVKKIRDEISEIKRSL